MPNSRAAGAAVLWRGDLERAGHNRRRTQRRAAVRSSGAVCSVVLGSVVQSATLHLNSKVPNRDARNFGAIQAKHIVARTCVPGTTDLVRQKSAEGHTRGLCGFGLRADCVHGRA